MPSSPLINEETFGFLSKEVLLLRTFRVLLVPTLGAIVSEFFRFEIEIQQNEQNWSLVENRRNAKMNANSRNLSRYSETTEGALGFCDFILNSSPTQKSDKIHFNCSCGLAKENRTSEIDFPFVIIKIRQMKILIFYIFNTTKIMVATK